MKLTVKVRKTTKKEKLEFLYGALIWSAIILAILYFKN